MTIWGIPGFARKKKTLPGKDMLTFNKSMPSAVTNAHVPLQQQLHPSVEDENKVLPNWTNPALYKTRFCDHFRTKGECKFGMKCWFAHGREELRSVPRLDRHPEAALNAVNQVIDSLPPSLAMSKSQQLYQELMQKKADSADDLPDDLPHEYVCPPKGNFAPRNFVYYQMPHAVFAPANYTIVSNSAAIRYANF